MAKDHVESAVAEKFRQEGFWLFPDKGTRRVWVRNDGAVVPYFHPELNYKWKAYRLLGGIGVVVGEFELWWNEFVKEIYGRKKSADIGILFTRHLMNYEEFQEVFPLHNERLDIDALNEWIDRIIARIAALPKDFESLTNDLAAGYIGPTPLSGYSGDPVKRLGYAKWLQQKGIEVPLGLVPDFGEQYLSPYQRLLEYWTSVRH